MKSFFYSFLLLTLITSSSFAQSYYSQPSQRRSTPRNNTGGYVNPNTNYNNGYIKQNGSYVQPHYKTQSNQTNLDNYSTQDNVNPYTSEKGSKAKDYSIDAYNYGSGKAIHTGERGGQYYINDNGNKVYVPKR